MYTLVVLNDGETYSEISGCSIVVINQAGMELLEAGYRLKDITPEVEIAMNTVSQPLEVVKTEKYDPY
jgi:hypothetical protein